MSLVNNLSDVIIAIGQAIKKKQNTLESGVNIKTINNQSILGTGDLSINNDGVILNPNVISKNITIPGTSNASATGPLTLEDGIEITIEDGASFIIA